MNAYNLIQYKQNRIAGALIRCLMMHSILIIIGCADVNAVQPKCTGRLRDRLVCMRDDYFPCQPFMGIHGHYLKCPGTSVLAYDEGGAGSKYAISQITPCNSLPGLEQCLFKNCVPVNGQCNWSGWREVGNPISYDNGSIDCCPAGME